MSVSSRPKELFRAVHAEIDRVESDSQGLGVRSRLDGALRHLGEAVDELAVASRDAVPRDRSVRLEPPLNRLSRACEQLEAVLAELEVGASIAQSVLSLLAACSALAIAIMDAPAKKSLLSVA